jgi:hypothetical protein
LTSHSCRSTERLARTRKVYPIGLDGRTPEWNAPRFRRLDGRAPGAHEPSHRIR